MALKLKIDKDDPIELAVMTVTDVDSAKIWLRKNNFRVIETVPPINPTQTTMLTICGGKYSYSRIRRCKFTWLVWYAKNSNIFFKI